VRELGHVEGKTFVLAVRHGDGKLERFPELAREIVALEPDVIGWPLRADRPETNTALPRRAMVRGIRFVDILASRRIVLRWASVIVTLAVLMLSATVYAECP